MKKLMLIAGSIIGALLFILIGEAFGDIAKDDDPGYLNDKCCKELITAQWAYFKAEVKSIEFIGSSQDKEKSCGVNVYRVTRMDGKTLIMSVALCADKDPNKVVFGFPTHPPTGDIAFGFPTHPPTGDIR